LNNVDFASREFSRESNAGFRYVKSGDVDKVDDWTLIGAK